MSERKREDHGGRLLMESVVASRKALGGGVGRGVLESTGERSPSGCMGRVNSDHTFKLVGGCSK